MTRLPFLASTFRQRIDRSVKRIPAEFVSKNRERRKDKITAYLHARRCVYLRYPLTQNIIYRAIFLREKLASECASKIYSERQEWAFKSLPREWAIYSRTCMLMRLLCSRQHTCDDLRRHRRLVQIDLEKRDGVRLSWRGSQLRSLKSPLCAQFLENAPVASRAKRIYVAVINRMI